VVVPDDQLALAIGKEGMNARLAARLTGWKVDIKSDTEFATEEAEAAFAGEGEEDSEFTGRCAAVLSTGKRCPNAALPGSRYCGVPAHQELAHKEAEVPATEAPAAETPLATQEEVAEAEPVARIDEEQLEAEAAAAPVEALAGTPEPEAGAAGEPQAEESPSAKEDEPAA
jgi:transcription termination/antitermination protein NusA